MRGNLQRLLSAGAVFVLATGFVSAQQAGARDVTASYDFSDGVAFKSQFDHTVRRGKPDLNGLQMQLAFSF